MLALRNPLKKLYHERSSATAKKRAAEGWAKAVAEEMALAVAMMVAAVTMTYRPCSIYR